MNRNYTLREALKWGGEYLKDKGIDSYMLDAALLLCRAAGISKTELYTYPESILGGSAAEIYSVYIKKRGELMPLQYILKHCEFMGLDFYVDENVLIPRPDTECLVEAAICAVNERNYRRALDLCTGSGCIIISVLRYCPNAAGIGVDISREALDVAMRNAEVNGVSEKVGLMHCDIFTDDLFLYGKFDIIVSNPPYIRTDGLELLDDNVKRYEPLSALDGGCDGLIFFERITAAADGLLVDGGMLLFEIGYDQGGAVKNILRTHGFKDVGIKKDLAGLDRVVFGIKGTDDIFRLERK